MKNIEVSQSTYANTSNKSVQSWKFDDEIFSASHHASWDSSWVM